MCCERAWARPRSPRCRPLGYTNAGTLEFLVDSRRNFYFLEMNTRSRWSTR
jgi:acetyl/propionyl-CoA carboxylase alpha subunit